MKNFTKGPILPQMLLFSLPLVFTNLLQVLFNLCDVAVVGRFAGSNALGSVGSSVILVQLFLAFIIGMSGSINVLTALHIGAKNKKELSETVHTSIIISFVEGVIILLIGVFFSPIILKLLGTKNELIEGAIIYARICSIGMPALGIYNWGNAILSAAGNTKKPLYFLTISGVINIILNLFFVIICHLSVAGVALASVISQYALAVMIIVTMLKEKQDFRLELKKIRITKSKVPTITRLGILSGFQSAVFHFANLFVQAGVNSFDAILVSGNSAATNADSIIFESMAAFNTAGATFIGQNYGARDKKRMRTSYLTSLFLSMGLGLLLGSLLLVFGREFLSLFSSEPAVIDAGLKRLNIMALCYFLSALMDCTIAASRAIHKTGVPTFIVIMGSCVFRVLWVKTVFAIIGTIPSLYLLYPFSFVITGVSEIAYFIYSFKRISFKEASKSNSHKSNFDMNGKPCFKEHLT